MATGDSGAATRRGIPRSTVATPVVQRARGRRVAEAVTAEPRQKCVVCYHTAITLLRRERATRLIFEMHPPRERPTPRIRLNEDIDFKSKFRFGLV